MFSNRGQGFLMVNALLMISGAVFACSSSDGGGSSSGSARAMVSNRFCGQLCDLGLRCNEIQDTRAECLMECDHEAVTPLYEVLQGEAVEPYLSCKGDVLVQLSCDDVAQGLPDDDCSVTGGDCGETNVDARLEQFCDATAMTACLTCMDTTSLSEETRATFGCLTDDGFELTLQCIRNVDCDSDPLLYPDVGDYFGHCLRESLTGDSASTTPSTAATALGWVGASTGRSLVMSF